MISQEGVRGEVVVSEAGVARVRWDWRAARAALVAHWPRPVLLAILALSAALNLVWLDREGYANTYYAATVKSMLTGWRNFFFGAFDSGGFVTVDKPPLGLWVQAISAEIFGFSGLSLLVPQALAGVASVALLYWLVRRAWGPAAGLVAALALATMPISVVANRNNTQDSLVILALLGAAWAITRAAETGRLGPLLVAALLVGVGFNIKMLQAYLVLPGLVLVYLLGARRRWPVRLGLLVIFGVATLAASLAWVVAADLTPAGTRPYIGSSGNNSALSLVLGYNGLTRLTLALPEGVRAALRFLPVDVDLDTAPAMAPGVGEPGWLRLFNNGLAGQASWLLALAVAGLIAGLIVARPRTPLDARGQSLALWGGWLAGTGGFFSVARFFHLYYLTMLGPAIAALTGIGVAAFWAAWRRGGWRIPALPLALVGAAWVQVRLLQPYPAWSARLATPVMVACLIAAAGLGLVWLVPRLAPYAAPVLATVGVAALIAVPLVWSIVSVQNNNGAAWLPQAGPSNAIGFGGPGGGARPPQFTPPQGGVPQCGVPQAGRANTGGNAQNPRGNALPTGRGGGGGALTVAGANWDVLDARLVNFLLANQGGARYLVATTTSTYASVFMLATDQPALALGGYQGWDRILTPAELAAFVRDGGVRYFYLGASGQGFGGSVVASGSQDATADLAAWVRANCAAVPAARWQGSGGAAGGGRVAGLTLYDCAAVMATGR